MTTQSSKTQSATTPRGDSVAAKLGRTFFFIGFLATVAMALTAWIVSRHYLQEEARERLSGVRTLLQESLTDRIQRSRQDLGAQAASPAVSNALRELSLGRNRLQEELNALLQEEDIALDEEMADRLFQNVMSHYDQAFVAVLRDNLSGLNTDSAALGDFLQPDLRSNLLLNQFLPEDAVTDPDFLAIREKFSETTYGRAYASYGSRFQAQRELLGDTEIYLVDADGYVIFATEHLVDYHANLTGGPQAGSPLARAFDAAISHALFAEDASATEGAAPVLISAMEPYLPALGIPQVFLSAPIVSQDGAPLGAMIYRMPFTAFNTLATFRNNPQAAGLGQTGEALLLASGTEPGQFTMLTDARGIADNQTATLATLSLIDNGEPRLTTATRQGVDLSAFLEDPANTLQPATAIYPNYLGQPVLGAVAPLQVPGINWAVLVEQSVAEAFAPANQLALAIALCGLVVLLVIGALSVWSANNLSRPLKNLEDAMLSAADGNEKVRAEVVGNDELARLAETFNRLNSERLRSQKRLTVDNERLQSNIEELLVVAADASDGKLGVRARVTEGQLGNIASALNIMLENVGNFIEQIRVASGRVASASVEIATTAGDLAQGVEDQNRQIDDTAETVRELADEADDTVKATESAAEAANLTRQAAGRGAGSVKEVQETMDRIREKVQVNAQKIKRLGERSMEVSGIVKSISDISAQTDMLAFNASVESERGSEGRGFNMVADRVRDLAERTKQATVEIERLVSSMQNETAEAVLQMEKMTEEVESGSARVQTANTSLQNIVDSSHRSSDLVEQIREIAGKQRAQAQSVLEAMNSLAEIAERAADKVQQNRQTSDQLADLSSDLNAQISEFDTGRENSPEAQLPQHFASSRR